MGPEGSTEMMGFEDYKEQVTADALEAIREGAGWCVTWDEMLDELHIDDAVTGGGSGSYTFCAATSLENVRGLLGDEAFAAEAPGWAAARRCSPWSPRRWTCSRAASRSTRCPESWSRPTTRRAPRRRSGWKPGPIGAAPALWKE